MKEVDNIFLAEQNKLSGSRAVEQVRVYKRYPWPITEVNLDNIKVTGHAVNHFSTDDWFIITTRKFSTKFRITSSPTYASGETTIPSTLIGNDLETAQDVGGYIAKRFDVERQVLKIGSINQSFEGPTLNEFRTGGATIEMNDRAYITLYDEENSAGVFFQKSWTDVISSVSAGASTTAFAITTGGLTANALQGYVAQVLSGPYEGKGFPIIANAVGTVTILGALDDVIVGDQVHLAIENFFYAEILAGFKNSL